MIIHCKLKTFKETEIINFEYITVEKVKFVIKDDNVNKFNEDQKYILEEIINDRMNDDIIKNVYPEFKLRLLKKAYNIYKFDIKHNKFKDDLIEAFKEKERKEKEMERLNKEAFKVYNEKCNELECVKKMEKIMKETGGFDKMTDEEFKEYNRLLLDEFEVQAKKLKKQIFDEYRKKIKEIAAA